MKTVKDTTATLRLSSEDSERLDQIVKLHGFKSRSQALGYMLQQFLKIYEIPDLKHQSPEQWQL